MAQVFASVPLIWKTWFEVLVSSFDWPSYGHRGLGSEPAECSQFSFLYVLFCFSGFQINF